MLRSKLLSKRNPLESVLKKKVRELENARVEVGHFKEQGQHYSGYTYPNLMRLHAAGELDKFPARPLLKVVKFQLSSETKKESFRRYLDAWSKAIGSQTSTTKLLTDIGEHVARFEKSLFGVPSVHISSNAPSTIAQKGKNTPLEDLGDLKGKVAHRNSTTKTIKEAR